ncbi:MAG: site-specific DNA-methyltransferase [Candidatus Aminicenantes bacterium]|nr:site-specific DNA-methyltransferase [Candidatus Aminicenantes bacterium]
MRTEVQSIIDPRMSQRGLKFAPPWNYANFISGNIKPVFNTSAGVLFEGDCLKVLPLIKSETIDLVFADPPFNLGKEYGNKVNDKLTEKEYIVFGKKWISECSRTLKDGGSFFIYNLPKWNIIFGAYLLELGFTFRHWIAINIKASLPIQGRLYPSHYSLLYFSKGKPNTFRKIRTPIEKCRHCGGEIKDYGGHRNAMNPLGVNLTDVWNDIPPVRHWKFKSKKRKANQLSTKLLSRVVYMSTNRGDVVLDPFGGSGTTFDVCENERRHWIGIDLESCDVIIERLESGNLHYHPNNDYVE